MICVLCGYEKDLTVWGATEAGWESSYFLDDSSDQEDGPVCGGCVSTRLEIGPDGLVLNPEEQAHQLRVKLCARASG